MFHETGYCGQRQAGEESGETGRETFPSVCFVRRRQRVSDASDHWRHRCTGSDEGFMLLLIPRIILIAASLLIILFGFSGREPNSIFAPVGLQWKVYTNTPVVVL